MMELVVVLPAVVENLVLPAVAPPEKMVAVRMVEVPMEVGFQTWEEAETLVVETAEVAVETPEMGLMAAAERVVAAVEKKKGVVAAVEWWRWTVGD